MPGDEHRQELVADLLVAHHRAVLVTSGRGASPGCRPARARTGSARRSAISSNSSPSASRCTSRNRRIGPTRASSRSASPPGGGPEQADRPLTEGEHLGQRRPQRVEPRPRIEPEHRAEDDLEGQTLHPGVHLDRLPARPGGDLAGRRGFDRASQPAHRLAVEGREQQLALLHVRGLVEQDHRVGADDRLEHPRAGAGMEHVGGRGEHLPDLVRVAQHHERRRERQAEREPPAVPRPAALEERQRPRPEADALQEGGQRGTRWEIGAHRDRSPTACAVCRMCASEHTAMRSG